MSLHLNPRQLLLNLGEPPQCSQHTMVCLAQKLSILFKFLLIFLAVKFILIPLEFETFLNTAAALIKHITITDANYFLAWKLLANRYDTKNHIVQPLLKTFIDQPKSSHLSVSHLSQIIRTSNEVVHSLLQPCALNMRVVIVG